MKKYRVRLKNNSWLSFDEETGEIKLPEHFGIDLMYNNDLSKEQIKKVHGKALEQDFNEILKELKQEEHKNLELSMRINKAIEYINKLTTHHESYDYDIDYDYKKEIIDILKGDNK